MNDSYNYFFDNVTQAYKDYTFEGAKRWNDTNIVSIYEWFGTSNNKVMEYWDPDTSTNAYVASVADLDGHKTSWTMAYNRSNMDGRTIWANQNTAAHEMGHTIGVADLYLDGNNDKLMYGYSNRTVTHPTTKDKDGATEATK